MVDAVTSQTLQDADDYAVMRFTNTSDSTGEAAVLKVDVSTLDASGRNGAACSEVIIEEIEFTMAGMSVQILWDADTDVVAAVLGCLAGAYNGKMNFCNRGLTNNSGAGKTGDIKFTTLGAGANDSYDITLKMRKKYAS